MRGEYNELMEWMIKNGANDNEMHSLEIMEDLPTGRGVVTKKDILKGEVVCKIPINLVWTSSTVQRIDTIGEILSKASKEEGWHGIDRDEEVLAIGILWEKSLGSSSKWYSWINSLPKSHSNILFFTETELNALEGTSISGMSKQLINQVIEDYNEFIELVYKPNSSSFPTCWTLEEWKWSMSTVWSRAMDFFDHDNPIRSIVPFADMFNGLSPAMLDDTVCHLMDGEEGCVTIIAGKDFQGGDEVFINYGGISNARLLMFYGFTYPENPNDSIPMYAVVSNPESDPLYSLKNQVVLGLFGKQMEAMWELSMEEALPSALISSICIQLCHDEKVLEEYKSKSVESLQFDEDSLYMAVSILRNAIVQMMSTFPTQFLEDDEDSLFEEGMQDSEKLKNSIRVRLAEKRILFQALSCLNQYDF
jgi:hypothetical protein